MRQGALTAADISYQIGRRLSARRRELHLSLAQLAAKCDVSLQQIHKYETGASVISAPMLWRLSRCLDVPLDYFFEQVEA